MRDFMPVVLSVTSDCIKCHAWHIVESRIIIGMIKAILGRLYLAEDSSISAKFQNINPIKSPGTSTILMKLQIGHRETPTRYRRISAQVCLAVDAIFPISSIFGFFNWLTNISKASGKSLKFRIWLPYLRDLQPDHHSLRSGYCLIASGATPSVVVGCWDHYQIFGMNM